MSATTAGYGSWRLPGGRWVAVCVQVVAAAAVSLCAWAMIAALLGAGSGVPAPGDVGSWWWAHHDNIWLHARQTASEASRGFLIGNVLAIGVAVIAFLVPRVERAALSAAIVTYCLPLIAIGPILQITLHGDTPRVALAALSVFFTTMVGVLSGLHSASPVTLDVIRSLGGNQLHELRFVRVQQAFGALLTSLTLAAPAAMLGAILGEFLGGERGLGVALVNAQKTADPVRAWAYGLTTVALAAVATMMITALARVFGSRLVSAVAK